MAQHVTGAWHAQSKTNSSCGIIIYIHIYNIYIYIYIYLLIYLFIYFKHAKIFINHLAQGAAKETSDCSKLLPPGCP